MLLDERRIPLGSILGARHGAVHGLGQGRSEVLGPRFLESRARLRHRVPSSLRRRTSSSGSTSPPAATTASATCSSSARCSDRMPHRSSAQPNGSNRRRVAISLACAAALWLAIPAGRAAAPRFYSDDPLAKDPESQDAAKVQALKVSDQYDLVENSFLGAGEHVDVRAGNVNTIDEVPDSSWFTNRARPLDLDALVKGPDTANGPAPGPWTVTSAQRRRRHARIHHSRQRRRGLLDQVRPGRLRRDGERRRGHLHQVLPRLRLSRRRELPRLASEPKTCRWRPTPR